jgi:hypothetical protein
MIQDIFQRMVVTALFVLSAAECVFAIATGRRARAHVVGRLLQLIMAVAMLAMAWAWGKTLPTIGLLVFFLLAALWFVAVCFTDDGHRVVNGYHALKMLAMSWMYAVMSGNLLPSQVGAARDERNVMSQHTGMPGMDMSGVDDSSSGGGHPAWIDAINWIWAIGFAIAAPWWVYWYFAHRKPEPTKPWHRFLGVASQAMMAAGMAITFAVMP